MTLDELKKQYERFSEMSEKRGDEYRKQAQDLVLKDDHKSSSTYYNLASTAYNESAIYMCFVDDLNKVTK